MTKNNRFLGINKTTIDRLYRIANTHPSEDIEGSLIRDALKDINAYEGETQMRVGVEFTAATLAHTQGRPDKYGPFSQE